MVLLAWILNLASTVLLHFMASALFEVTDVAGAWLLISDAPNVVPLPNLTYYVRASQAIIVLSITCLWSIQISFLIFFRRITASTCFRGRSIHWWAVSVVTLASYVICIAGQPYSCDFRNTVGRCAHAAKLATVLLINGINTALDLLTDILSNSRTHFSAWH